MQAGSSQGKASKEPKEIAALPQGMEKQVVVKPLKLQTEKEHRPRISEAKCGHLPKNALKTLLPILCHFFHFLLFLLMLTHQQSQIFLILLVLNMTCIESIDFLSWDFNVLSFWCLFRLLDFGNIVMALIKICKKNYKHFRIFLSSICFLLLLNIQYEWESCYFE